MNTVLELFESAAQEQILERVAVEPTTVSAEGTAWNQELFAEEQLRSLVRQIFFPGWSKSAKQVVFAAVDHRTSINQTCLRVAGALEAQATGTICMVQTEKPSVAASAKEFMTYGGTAHDPPSVQDQWESLRKSSRQVSERLWILPMPVFLGGQAGGRSAAWLHGRLEQLRHDFDYALFQAPPAGSSSQAALFGNLCDGVILILEARSTRRLAAQKVKAMLHAANARLLGTILTERTFPIPERLYRRL